MSDNERRKSIQLKRKIWRNQFIRKKIKNRNESGDQKDEGYKKYKPEEVLLSKLGGSKQFNDVLIDQSYEWNLLTYSDPFKQKTGSSEFLSLKECCAEKIAENSGHLTFQLLKTGSWSHWSLVWKYISLLDLDSFSMFNMFATAFQNEPSFSCHQELMHCPSYKKRMVLSSTVNPAKHRLERLFDNLKISILVKSLNFSGFENVVILDLSTPNVSQDDLLELTNFKNLISLRISKIQPTDSTIHTWCNSIKSSKWQRLQLLSITEISKLSFIKLQNVAKYGKLMLIELMPMSDTFAYFNMIRDWPDVDYTNWELLKEDPLKGHNWSMKSLSLMKLHKIERHSIDPDDRRTFILDFSILNKQYQGENAWAECNQLWSIQTHDTRIKSQIMVLKKKLEIKTSTTLTNNSLKPKKKRLKVAKPISMKSFFDIK